MKNLITLAGILPEEMMLTWNNTTTKIKHHQAAHVIGTGTFGCGTTILEGEDFIAENITFENSAPEGSGQAVAIRVTAVHSTIVDFSVGRLFQFPKYGKNIPKTLSSQIDSFVIPQSTSLSDKSFFLRKLLAAIGGILAVEALRKLDLEMTIMILAFFTVGFTSGVSV
ncbi:hypothetical protein OROHE_026283 [Orobanche hederae]